MQAEFELYFMSMSSLLFYMIFFTMSTEMLSNPLSFF